MSRAGPRKAGEERRGHAHNAALAEPLPHGGLSNERERITSLVSDLSEESAAIAEVTSACPDDEHDAEGSTVAYERARVQALLAHARRRLVELDAAAQRMADGTHRNCEQCGRQIGEARLAALLTTTTCITCATNTARS